MKYAKQYIKTAVEFIRNYDGAVPLNHYLKSKFSIEKKYGSKDRKYISHLCYAYFRLGHFLKDI
ncbi:MAG: Fmu (Sun) domain protein, partial [Segetibacter sp.]